MKLVIDSKDHCYYKVSYKLHYQSIKFMNSQKMSSTTTNTHSLRKNQVRRSTVTVMKSNPRRQQTMGVAGIWWLPVAFMFIACIIQCTDAAEELDEPVPFIFVSIYFCLMNFLMSLYL